MLRPASDRPLLVAASSRAWTPKRSAALLRDHFAYGATDPQRAHAMYHEDAVLEFPQSGERFVGVDNFREWRAEYPASTGPEITEVRGAGDVWVAELAITYDGGAPHFGVSILEFRDEPGRARDDLRLGGVGSAGMAGALARRRVGRRASLVPHQVAPTIAGCMLTRFRMFPSGSLNQTAFMSPMTWMSPSRVVSGRS